MSKRNVLLVEDDENLAFLLKENLESNGYKIFWCRNGDDGLRAFSERSIALCVLDIMMPRKDGLTLAKEIRKQDDRVPIIFLTAKSQSQNKIDGFLAGCDDYVTKPFSVKELLLRIHAVLRRTARVVTKPSVYTFGRFTFNTATRQLCIDGECRVLNAKEAGVLALLCESEDTFVNRRAILNNVWNNDDFLTGKSLDVYLTRLRKALRPDPTVQIENLYGTGYRLTLKPTVGSA